MSVASSYTMLEDVALADAAFEAWGDTASELFAACAEAVIETMVNRATVGTGWTRQVILEGSDPAALLFDWLSTLVYLKDADAVVFHDARVEVAEDPAAGLWRLHGELRGAAIDPARQELRADVKAVTKHLYAVEQRHGRWCARVVLDI